MQLNSAPQRIRSSAMMKEKISYTLLLRFLGVARQGVELCGSFDILFGLRIFEIKVFLQRTGHSSFFQNKICARSCVQSWTLFFFDFHLHSSQILQLTTVPKSYWYINLRRNFKHPFSRKEKLCLLGVNMNIYSRRFVL